MPRSPEQYQPGDIEIISKGVELDTNPFKDGELPITLLFDTPVEIVSHLESNALPVRLLKVQKGDEDLLDQRFYWHQPEPSPQK